MRLGSHLAFALVTVAATSAFGGIGKNGVQMNGVQMNGVQMNGVQMNGVQMNGVQMNGVQMNGVAVNGLNLSGSWLNGTIAGTSACRQVVTKSYPYCSFRWDAGCANAAVNLCKVTPEQLKGAVFTVDTNAGPRYIRLDNYELAPDPAPVWRQVGKFWFDANADVWAYHFSVYNRGFLKVGTWLPLCGSTPDSDGMVNAALAVAGHWNDCTTGKANGCGGRSSPDGFSLACNDVGAIAKCVQRFQYKPWHSVTETASHASGWQPLATHVISLDKFHQTCVRMVRGDYCGDGNAHTVDGTSIDVWDKLPVQSLGLVPVGYQLEAEWTPSGANCVSLTRYQTWGGSMTPGPNSWYPDAIAACTDLSPVRRNPVTGEIAIIDGCGNSNGHMDSSPDPDPNVTEWPRSTYITNQSIH